MNYIIKKTYVLLGLLSVLTAHSQVVLTGKVTDQKSKEPLFGVNVFIPDLLIGATTDTSGTYKIVNLPKRKVLIRISYIGYKTIIEPVDLKTTTLKDFTMEESPEEMNEVVVTGTSKATDIRRSPVPIVVMDDKTIDMNLNTNIINALAKLPGISEVTTGPNISKPFIHGLGYNRVLTLYDGVRQEGQQWGDEHGIEVDEYGIYRAEIVKGPSSLIYGSDALAGVVNLLPFPAVQNGTIQGNFLGEYQTNNGLFGGSLSLDGNQNGIIWGGRISHKQAKDYQDKYDGRVYNTAFSETDANMYTGINKKWGYSHLNFSLFNDLQEIPDGSRDSATRQFTKQISEADTFRPIVSKSELNSYKISVLHQHIQHYRIYSTSDIFLGPGKIGIIIGYQYNIRQEFSHPMAPDTPGLGLHLNTITYDLKYYLPELKGWEITPGVNGMYQINSNKGTEFIIPDYQQFDFGLFLLVKKSFDKIDISAGARYDMRFFSNDQMYIKPDPTTGFDMEVSPADTAGATRQFSAFKHTFSGLSGSAGLTYNVSKDFSIKANVARGFRAPNISEISANGVHPGTNIYQIGNPNFKPEFSLQGDLGLFYSSKPVIASIEGFYTDISNYIFNQKILNHLGQDSIIVKGNETFKFVQSEAVLYGGEASLDIHFFKWMHFENTVSVVYGINKGGNGTKINDSSKYLPFIPPLHTHSELRVEFDKGIKHFSAVYALIAMEYYAKQNRAYLADNTETPTPGYTLFDAGIGGEVTKKNGKVICGIHLAASNIFDIAYQSHLSRLKYFEFYPNNPTGRSGIYDMGRNISIKVTIPIDVRN
ncbi:MAG: TonB-dependent receptor [Bacteroidales bacterium]|jgi:iron complex outermembrane receptor protein